MLHLDLLRHGSTTRSGYYGSTDIALDDVGAEQMRQAVQGRCWDRILTSPLQRCAGFAAALARQLRLPCAADPRLREMHFGAWEGRNAEQLQAVDAPALERFWNDPLAYPPPDAEPLPEVRRRLLDLVGELLPGSAGQRLLLVTHGGPIRVLLSVADERPMSQLLHIEVPHAAMFHLQARTEQGGKIALCRVVG